ncbi:MAG: hypothetical protein ABJE95_08575 [Byssovorax sp.]
MSHDEVSSSGLVEVREAEIDFETWAELSARLLKLDQEARFDFLEEREIDPASYARAEQRWVMALSDDLSAEEMGRVDLYASKCAAEMARRAAAPAEVGPADVETPTPLEAPVAPVPATSAAVVSLPALARSKALLSGTMMTPEGLPGSRQPAAALPFGPTASPSFAAGMSAPRVAAPEPTVGGETLPLGVDLLGSLRKELPFMKGAAAPAPPAAAWPQLPLDTYASLCAELAVFPERAAEILKKYGIADEAVRRGVDREWTERLAAHPTTQDLWQRKVGEFRAWLHRGGR